MVNETEQRTLSTMVRKRKKTPKKHRDSKKMKGGPGMRKKVKISQKMQKLYRKRARDYNSDDEVEDECASESDDEDMEFERDDFSGNSDDEEGDDQVEDSDAEHEVQSGITKFVDGCNAFRLAFCSIMKKIVEDESLVLYYQQIRNLLWKSLQKRRLSGRLKGKQRRKSNRLRRRDVKLANFLDSHDKFLIGVATKGVVKLFNAVNKAQMAQKGFNPSSFKDAKALTKRRKEAFITELNKASAQSAEANTKASISKGEEDNRQPTWAPLRDTYMLTNSKLKDWDKMAEDEVDI